MFGGGDVGDYLLGGIGVKRQGKVSLRVLNH